MKNNDNTPAEVEHTEAPAKEDNVLPFSEIRPRLARGGNFGFGGGGGSIGDSKHTNYLKYIPAGAMFLAKTRKTPSAFVLDRFRVYQHIHEAGITSLIPLMPGMEEGDPWWVEQQTFCDTYQHYITIETDNDEQHNRSD